jgi:hypothetical protein
MLDAATFVNLRLLTVGGMLAIKHEIREKRWTAKVLRLIDWYCRFWDEVAAHIQDRWSDLRDGLVDDGRKRGWEKGWERVRVSPQSLPDRREKGW